MHTTIVTINGMDVTINNYEIPALIAALSTAYQKLLASGDIGAEPTDGYMTYHECHALLSNKYTGHVLTRRTGRLWGAMCRLTRSGRLNFKTHCNMCKKPVQQHGYYKETVCAHVDGKMGHRMIKISTHSMQKNLDKMINGHYKQIGQGVREDYLYVIGTLTK